MTISISPRFPPRPMRRDKMMHHYAVGQEVRFKMDFMMRFNASPIYHITATLSPRGESPQYRIRNDDERHERVAAQDDLEPVIASTENEGAALMERTFGNGQGSKA